MKLQFEKADFSYMLDSMQGFLEEKYGVYFSESIYRFHPSIEKERMEALESSQRRAYLETQLIEIEQNIQGEIAEKLVTYQQYWEDNKQTIIPSLEQIFGVSLEDKLNDMVARIGLNPICPRYLDTHAFDVFYLCSPVGALEIALHEIVHFVWFMVWQELFHDSEAEYETPNLKWVFSEMVVDPILKEDSIAKYTLYDKPAYEYFYQIEVEGQNFIALLRKLYEENSMPDFMIKGYALCQKYEPEIRKVMY